MPPVLAAIDVDFSELSAALGVITTLAAIAVWALKTRFISRGELDEKFDGLAAELRELAERQNAMETESRIRDADGRSVTNALMEIKATLAEGLRASAARDEKFVEALSAIDRRLAVVETRIERRRQGE